MQAIRCSRTDPPNPNTKHTRECTPSTMQLPPSYSATPKPTQPPFSATEENRQCLQEWLLDYYKSSTFITCEHQPLPMRLMTDPDGEPIAHHTPVPVPLHWQEDMKAGLDHDVPLGVLEPMAVGELVIWCHWIAACKEKWQTLPHSGFPGIKPSCHL